MNENQKNCLLEAMMLLEIAFMGGASDWKNDVLFSGLDESDIGAFAHGLIQCADTDYKNEDYHKAKELVAKIKARMAIQDAQDSSRC